MDIKEYFQVISAGDKVVHIKLSKFWSDEIIDEIGAKFIEQFKAAVETLNNTKFVLLVDMTDFGQPSKKTQAYIGQAIEYSMQQGTLYKVVEIIPKVTLKMGVDKVAKTVAKEEDFAVRTVVKSMPEAKVLVEQFKKEI